MAGVKLFLCLFVFGFAIPGLSAFVEWNSLKATWCPPNMNNPNCFQDIPRTVDSALKRGWRKVHGSTCLNGGKFFGHRMVKENDYALTPLYDEKGIIAGVQVNALKSELFATKNPYKFDEVPDFLDNSIEGQPIYSTTTYFVNPTQICSIGRSRHQFEFEGTASQIYFQTGRNPSHLRSIPIYRDIAEKNYTRANCVNTMGHHNYYNVPKMQLSNCTTIIPSFLLFNNNGELHGFGQTTIGKLSSQFFEHPNIAAVRSGLDPITPECMLNMAESAGSPGYSNIHFFLIDSPKAIKCAPIVQTRAIHDSTTINPNAFKKH